MNHPVPSVLKQYPVTNSRSADKFVVRFPDGMRDDLAERARQNKRSMNSEMIALMADQINGVSSDRSPWIPAAGQLVFYENRPYRLVGFNYERDVLLGRIVAVNPVPFVNETTLPQTDAGHAVPLTDLIPVQL